MKQTSKKRILRMVILDLCGFCVLAYLVFIVALKAITKEELELVPKGDKLAKLLRIQ